MNQAIFGYSSGLLLAVGLAGCSAPNSQLTSCQQDKEQLLATIREQRDTTRDLKTQVASLETRLNQAETELARGTSGTRISRAPASVDSKKSTPAAKSDSLPWRLPPVQNPTPNKESGGTKGASFHSPSASLASLADRDRRLQYDRVNGTARIDLPISADSASATLTGEEKRQLDDVARLLKSDAARDFRVMVAGGSSTTRAQAVANYLDSHGIAEERLGVSGTGSPTSSSGSRDERLATTGVQIFLLEPNASVAGWNTGGQGVRR